MFETVGLAALAGGAVAGLVYWAVYAGTDTDSWRRSLVKTATLAPLAALLVWESLRSGVPGPGVALGLCLGVAGDFLLSRPGAPAFLAGMIAFALGHLAYAVALLARSQGLGFDGISLAEAVVLVLLAGLILSSELWLTPHTGRLRWSVRAYVGLSAMVAVVAVMLPQASGQDALRWGIALFLLSDVLLALRLFVIQGAAPRRSLGLLLWPAYVLGQGFIAGGAILLWTPAG